MCACILLRLLFLVFLYQYLVKKYGVNFLTRNVWEFYTSKKKTNDIFGILRKLWVWNMCFVCKILIWKFDIFWPDLDLTSVKSHLWWRHGVRRPSLSMSTCKITQKTCVTWHLCDFYFLINFCDLTLTLTFSNMTFVLTRYASQTFAST